MKYFDKILSIIISTFIRFWCSSKDWVEFNSEKYFNDKNAVLIYYPDSNQIIKSPQNIDGKIIQYSLQQTSVKLPTSYLAVSSQIRVSTNEGFIILPNRKVLGDTFWSLENAPEYLPNLIYSKECGKELKGDWYSVLLFWGEGYYHWLCDVLPRLIKVYSDLPSNIHYIVPSHLTLWQKQSLVELGILPDRWLNIDENNAFKCERLWYNPPVAMTGDHDAEVVHQLHTLFTKNIESSIVKRIYISRKKAQKRHIINEDVLFEYLQTKGFEMVCLEDLTWEATKLLFHQSEFVVAPHGAGLSNILFSKSGIHVLEIFEKNTHRRCFQTLAATRNINHYFYEGETVDIGWPSEYNIKVSMEDFKPRFEKWWETKLKKR